MTENYFKLDFNKCGLPSYEIVDYNTENPTTLMKVDEEFPNMIKCAPMLDPNNDNMNLDWTFNQMHSEYTWLSAWPVMRGDSIMRSSLDNRGNVNVSTIKKPKPGDTKFEITDYFNNSASS